jgi:tetratricopeptide (TPR) repeat protein
MGHKIYAPNVHLFAFHSGQNSIKHSPSSTTFDEELLWKKCNDIFALFNVNQNLRVRKVSDGARVALLEGATENMILLPVEGLLPHEQEKHRITGCACPLKIEDSYALALNLRIPEFNEQGKKTDDVELSVFQDFNQEQCFLPKEINSSLGQTVILTAWLSQKQQPNQRLWREIADECVRNFLGNGWQHCPPLYQSGQLLGSPIFEYGNPYQPHSCGQIWVWLFVREVFNGKVDPKTDNNFGFFYQKLIDLLCYRQKIIKAYQQALDVYADLAQLNQTIKDIINKIAELPQENARSQVQSQAQGLSDVERSNLKDKLRILPKLALDYAEGIQAIEGYRQIIEINIKNYAEKLKQIQERIPNYDLSFLAVFTQKTCGRFQDDLKVKLSECVQKSGLVEKAIASIRGIVEIDNAQRDRTLEETLRVNGIEAQKRERNLQIWFALVVTCLAMSSISSQVSSPVRTVLNYIHPEQLSVSAGFFRFFLYNFYDVFLQTLVGVAVALLLGLIVWLIPKQSNLTKKSKD